MATYILQHRTTDNEITETSVHNVFDFHVTAGKIVEFLDQKGNVLFRIPTTDVISVQQILDHIL